MLLPLRIALSIGLGFLLGLSNLYIALRIGFTVGVAILTVFCWAGLDLLLSRIWRRWPCLDQQEYACYQSLTSAMSYGCGTVIATALAALLMTNERPAPGWVLTLWVMSMCGLGTILALPMRRELLKQLPFPSGTAAAQTVREINVPGRVKPFFLGLVLVWLGLILRDLLRWVPGAILLWPPTLAFSISPMQWGLGALLGPRTCTSMLLGGLFFFLLLPSWPAGGGFGPDNILWFAVGMMVCACLLELGATLGRSRHESSVLPLLKAMIPTGNFRWLATILIATILATNTLGLGVPLLTSLAVLALTVIFSAIACRVTGETDMVPTGALGKLSLLLFGFFHGGQVPVNMAATGVLAGSSAASADFMTDLKCGELLNCRPSRQFKYQFAGALIGPLLFVPLFLFLVGRVAPLGGEIFPAPAARIWLSVAQLDFSAGGTVWLQHRDAILWGALAGTLITLVASIPALKRWLPLAVPFALAAFLDLPTVFTLFCGSLLGWFVAKEKGFPIWCAMLAGESAATLGLLLLS